MINILFPDTSKALLQSDIMRIEQFPAAIEWANSKTANISYCIAVFFNYITSPRPNFSMVGGKGKTKSVEIAPVINYDIVKYVLSELFPCGSMLQENFFVLSKASDKWMNMTSDLIKDSISNKQFLQSMSISKHTSDLRNVKVDVPGLVIEPAAIQLIWSYVLNGMNILTYAAADNDKVKEKIELAELAVLNKRILKTNYGFIDDIENLSFQTLLYIIATLTDWLEITDVGEDEVKTAYFIIVPPSLQITLEVSMNNSFDDIIKAGIMSIELNYTDKAIKLLTSIMLQVKGNKELINTNGNAKKLINRFIGLSRIA